jgi:hypothetical protein
VKELSEELKSLSQIIEMKRSRSIKKDIYLAIDALSKMFGLSRMEEQCIIICLAIEVDSKYEKLYGYIQDDITKKKPTVDMVLRLLCGSFEDRLEARRIFKRESPLLKFLIGINEGSYGQTPLISQELKLHNRIVDFLLGHNYIDEKLVDFTFSSGLTETVEKPNYRTSANLLSENKLNIIKKIKKYSSESKPEGHNTVFNFYGPPGSGKKLLAEAVCKALKMPLLTADLSKLDTHKLTHEDALLRLVRESLLHKAVLCIENLESFFNEGNKSCTNIRYFVETVGRILPMTFLLSSEKLNYESPSDEVDYLDVEI